jgi:hypothetical protein
VLIGLSDHKFRETPLPSEGIAVDFV